MQISLAIAPLSPSPAPGHTIIMAPASLPVTPAGRWHPEFSAVTLSGGRVQSATGLNGPGVSAGAAGLGPLAHTDANGRRVWRFNGDAYLDLAQGLTFSNRNLSVFAVVRGGGGGVFGLGNVTGYGGGSTAVNAGGAALNTLASPTAPYLGAFGRAANADAVNGPDVVLGSQLQVAGVVSRTTANGGMRLSINDKAAAASQPSINSGLADGAEIGRNPYSPGASGGWARMDLYELVVYDRGLTDAEAAAVSAALMDHYGIAPITGQMVMDGDSITAGAGITNFWETAAYVASEPGTGRIPAGFRVVSVAISGNQVSHLVARRDAASSWINTLMPGKQNILAVEVGRNDFGSGGKTATEHYAAFIAYLNAATLGVLQKGWTVRVMVNISSGASLMTQITAYRAMLRSPQFLTDTVSGPGQAFEGRVSLVPLDLITHGASGTVFDTAADASDTAYFQPDLTHPNALGAWARITGADTPQYGVIGGL